MDEMLIVGTGALACLFAGKLAAAGVRVSMLGSWPEGLAALRRDGVTLVQPDGSEASYPVRALDDPAQCGPVKYVLVLVKSWQTERAARQLAGCLAEDGLALTLQNGLGNYEALAEALGAVRVAQGITISGATLLGPGRVRIAGEGAISLGHHARLKPLAGELRQAGFEVETLEDVQSLVWGKLAVNAAINPLTALLGVNNGALLERPSARRLMAELAGEVGAVARARGIRLPYDNPVAAAEQVAHRTAANTSSMLQDVQRGAPTEIEAINGAVVRAGEQVGVPTPVNYAMWQLVRALVEKYS
jgi:2-dehydropantoate 2-reductase